MSQNDYFKTIESLLFLTPCNNEVVNCLETIFFSIYSKNDTSWIKCIILKKQALPTGTSDSNKPNKLS